MPFSKAAASEEARRYAPYFVWLFALSMNLGERKSPSRNFSIREGFVKYVERLSEERTPPGKGASWRAGVGG